MKIYLSFFSGQISQLSHFFSSFNLMQKWQQIEQYLCIKSILDWIKKVIGW